MSWEKLPTEIVIYIFKIRNEIRNEIRNKASQTIQNAWLKYISLDINIILYWNIARIVGHWGNFTTRV